MTAAGPVGVPVLLVHGIWDSSSRLEPMAAGLRSRGVASVHAVDLVPSDGRAPIATLGALVAREAEAVAAREGVARVDLVGFSMGALVARWYVQRGGGQGARPAVRLHLRPAQGHGHRVRPSLRRRARDAPGSHLLRDLEGDPDPFGPVEVHCFYTPFDLMILPSTSSVLPGARSVARVSVAMHRFMIQSRGVLDPVAALLRA